MIPSLREFLLTKYAEMVFNKRNIEIEGAFMKEVSQRTQKQSLGPIGMVLLGVLFGATASIFIRYSDAPVLVLAAVRKTMAALIMLPLVLLRCREELKKVDRRTLMWCLLAGTFLGLHFATYFLSVRNTTVTAANVLAGTEVIFVSAFLYFTGQEKYNAKSVLGITVALLGGIVVSITFRGSPAVNAPLGNLCGVVCAILLGAYTLTGTYIRRTANLSNTLFTFFAYTASAVVLNLLVLVTGDHVTGYGMNNYIAALCLAIFCTFGSHSIFTWSLKYISPTLLAIMKILMPVPTAIIGFLVLKETPTWNQIAGGLVVIAGIIIYTLNANKDGGNSKENRAGAKEA